jgi:Leucine-rich repeat (LRR) protein
MSDKLKILEPEEYLKSFKNPYSKISSDELTTLLYLRGKILNLESISKDTKETKALMLIKDDLHQRNIKIQQITTIQAALRGNQKRNKPKGSMIVNKKVGETMDLFLKEKSTDLSLNGCSLKEIPESISSAASTIQTLDASKNLIEKISDWVCYSLNNVKILNLSHNCLSELPENFKEMKSLEELNLSFNQFETFPNCITFLNLLKLDISYNLLDCIPSSIKTLKELTEIDVSNNVLTKIPKEMLEMSNLKIAHIHENRPEDPDTFKEIEVKLNFFFRQRRDKRRVGVVNPTPSSNAPPSNSPEKKKPIGILKTLHTKSQSWTQSPQPILIASPIVEEDSVHDEPSEMGNIPDIVFETPQNAIRHSMAKVNIPLSLLNALSGSSSKDDDERAKVLQEIVDSEVKYVEFLSILMENYVKPIRGGLITDKKKKIIVTKKEAATLFPPDLTSIFSFNTELLKDLKSKSPQIRHISEIFIRMSPMFKLYIGYTKTYQNSLNEIRFFTKEKKSFSEWCTSVKIKCGMTISSLMVMPIQRIPRYRLLFESVLKVTPEEHPVFSSST